VRLVVDEERRNVLRREVDKVDTADRQPTRALVDRGAVR
jgi:hypothetical protein